MQIPIFYKGQDILFRIQMKKNGVADPVSNYENIAIQVINKKGQIMSKIAMAELEGYITENFQVVDEALGKCEVWIPSVDTAEGVKGQYMIEILVQKEVAAPWSKVFIGKGKENLFYLDETTI
jgi:hypothetical protein